MYSSSSDWLSGSRLANKNRAGSYAVDVGAAPTGFGSQYDELFAANPYRGLSYDVSGWQSMLKNLGFRTKLDDYIDQARINAAEYDAGIMSQIQQNEFNDPSSMAARERAAGINPDLAGIGDVASAAGPTDDPNGMNVSSSNDLEQVATFGNILLSCCTQGMSLVKSVGDITGIGLGNQGMRIENGKNLFGLSTDFILHNTPAGGFKSNEDYQSWLTMLGTDAYGTGSASLVDSLGLTKGQRKRFYKQLGRDLSSIGTEAKQFELWKQRIGDAKDYRYSKNDHWDESYEIWQVINDEIIKLNSDITENSARLKDEATENSLEYQQSFDPALMGSAENASNSQVAQQKSIQTMVQSTLKEITSKLHGISEEGGFKGMLAQGVLLFLSLSQLQMSVGSGPKGPSGSLGLNIGM